MKFVAQMFRHPGRYSKFVCLLNGATIARAYNYMYVYEFMYKRISANIPGQIADLHNVDRYFL